MVKANNSEDAELVSRARCGDKKAFSCLIDRYQSMAKGIALKMVRNEEIAQDLAQEAMLQAYLCLDHLKDDSRFGNWLYGIVLNVCRSHIRDSKGVFLSLEAMTGGLKFDSIPFTALVPDPVKVAEKQEIYSLVLEAVNTLSPKNRTATLLFYQQQLSLQEIAALLGVSVAAVKGRLHKSRLQLKTKLLPLLTENDNKQRQSIQNRRNKMIEVSVADVIPNQEKNLHVIILWDKVGARILPVYVGRWESLAIALGMSDISTPRPMTYKFISMLLEAVETHLESVRIETLREKTYYAVVSLRSGDKVREVDARPSDAIALALNANSPIYVAKDLLEQNGIDIPGNVEELPFGKGFEEMKQQIEEEKTKYQGILQPKITAKSDLAQKEIEEEIIHKNLQELNDYLFGS